MQSKNYEKLIDEFIEDLRLQGRAEGTLLEYEMRLKEFAEFFQLKALALDQVKKSDLTEFMEQKLSNCLKVSTIRGKLSTFRVFCLWAVNKNYLSEVIISPQDYPKNTNVKRIRRLSDENLTIFKHYIDTLQPNARAAFYLLIGSGCRVAEAANLRAEDVTLRGKSVYINIRNAQWGSDRNIPIVDADAAKIVWKYRTEVEVDNRPLFRLSKRTLQNYATNFAKSTGINFYCHLLRHTFAGLLTEKGVPLTTVQYLLGHKSLGMTAHYAQSARVDITDITPEINL